MADKLLKVLSLLASSLLVACSSDDPVTGAPSPTPAARNVAPAISGTPPTSLQEGTAYNFVPGGHDADGDAISWSVEGKPSWASFDPATGALSGTPTTPGSFTGITIKASDGEATSVLGPFTINVLASAATPPTSGTALLTWTPPGAFTDGTALNPAIDLAGYRIYYGTDPSSLQRIAEVDAGTTSFTVGSLARGKHYFAVTAITHGSAESSYSSTGSKTIS